MKHIILSLFLISTFLFAGFESINATQTFISSGIKIIDIRTEHEWAETGIVKNSIPITFFDQNGKYNIETFLKDLNKHIEKNENFAIICRTGNRTTSVADFLGKNGYNVINLKGGIKSLEKQGYKLTPYIKRP